MTTLRQMVETKIRGASLGFKEVAGAAGLDNVLANRMSAPGCYCFRVRNRTGKSCGDNFVSQQRSEFIGLVIVTRNVADSRGADGSDENEAFCDLVQSQLLGWEPNNIYGPLEHAGGDLVMFKDGLFIWMELYRTERIIRSI